MKNFEKIWVNKNLPLFVSYPRTGGHWIGAVIEYYINAPRAPDVRDGGISFLPKANNNPHFWFHTHDSHMDISTDNPLGTVFLLRDPVDTIYSYISADGGTVDERIVQMDNLINKWIIGKKATLLITFEQMNIEPEQVLEKISKFFKINFDPNRAKKAIEIAAKEKILSINPGSKYHGKHLMNEVYASKRDQFRKDYGELITKKLYDKYKIYFDGEISFI